MPISPELSQVISRPNGTSLKVVWSDEKFIRTGYKIYPSVDGINFGAPISVASNVQSYIESGLTAGSKKYYKVSVIGTGGESKASRIYGAQVGGSPRVLIVDGDDRWQFQTTVIPSLAHRPQYKREQRAYRGDEVRCNEDALHSSSSSRAQ